MVAKRALGIARAFSVTTPTSALLLLWDLNLGKFPSLFLICLISQTKGRGEVIKRSP